MFLPPQGYCAGDVCRLHFIPLIKGVPRVQSIIVTILHNMVKYSSAAECSFSVSQGGAKAQWPQWMQQERAGVQQPA